MPIYLAIIVCMICIPIGLQSQLFFCLLSSLRIVVYNDLVYLSSFHLRNYTELVYLYVQCCIFEIMWLTLAIDPRLLFLQTEREGLGTRLGRPVLESTIEIKDFNSFSPPSPPPPPPPHSHTLGLSLTTIYK